MSSKVRDYRLDLMRVVAIAMIVLMHSPIPFSLSGFLMIGLSYLTAPGVGLFFMISGALLLGNDFSARGFLIRRFPKILVPAIFWTFFYLIVKCFTEPVNTRFLIKAFLSIPFCEQGRGVLWFIYTLSGLYLLTPILSRWLKFASENEVKFYLLLWCISLLYPYLEQILIINKSTKGILYYFTGYVGYYLLGYYMKTYYKYNNRHVIFAITVALVIPAVLYGTGYYFDFYSLLWYLSLPVALMAFAWFAVISHIRTREVSLICEISRLSFGIYLVHIFIMRHIVWYVGFIKELPGVVQTPVIMIITFLLSFLVVKFISRLPVSRYIVGV